MPQRQNEMIEAAWIYLLVASSTREMSECSPAGWDSVRPARWEPRASARIEQGAVVGK